MTNRKLKMWALASVLIIGVAGCQATPDDPEDAQVPVGEPASVYIGHGRLVELLADSLHVKVKHGTIEGLMDAMEMSFPLKSTDVLQFVAAGDSIRFEIHIQSDGFFYLENVEHVEATDE